MDYAYKERIGKPELFTGRKEELKFFLNWIEEIKQEKSQSTALLARRKMGKTAIMERLFNITFFKNDNVIPFYYEVRELKMWVGDFCLDFFLTFIYQYIAFKSRKPNYLGRDKKNSLEAVKKDAIKEGLDHLIVTIDNVAYSLKNNQVDILWNTVREAPKTIASSEDEFIIQMIDEFQFLNAMIYWDKEKKNLADNLAGGYLSTAESKIAPLLVTGSWVGWLMYELMTMLPSRFKYEFLNNMPEDEAVEMIYKFSQFFEVPMTEEIIYLMAKLAEGSPFYMSSIIRSSLRKKDLTTIQGFTETLEFETLDDRGAIKFTWMEYIAAALPKINDRNAKNIVLHLCKNRDRELTRAEILQDLNLDISDSDLEKRLKALVKADIISQGQTNFDYRGVRDNIFDKVFRGVYEKEIHHFDVRVIKEEYGDELELLKKQYDSLLGKFNYQKGLFAEYLLQDQLRIHGRENNELLKSITRYLPSNFNFCQYSRVWRYDRSPAYAKSFNVDVFARALDPADYSLIVEVKSRDTRKFSIEEAVGFERKFEAVKEFEKLTNVVGFIFSRSGFTNEAEDYCKMKGFACSEDERWLGNSNQ
jgi:hypothetical protein